MRRPSRLRIAVDLDGVLAETMTAWCVLANQKFGTRLTIEDFEGWAFGKASWRKFGISKGEFFILLDEAWDDWEKVPPTEAGLAAKVRTVETLGSLDIVTGHSRKTVPSAKRWLSHHKIPYERFIRVGGPRDKVLLNYDVYIDDAPDLMPLVSRNPAMKAILYERPWNRNVSTMRGVFKVKDWSQVPKVLTQILRDKSVPEVRQALRGKD